MFRRPLTRVLVIAIALLSCVAIAERWPAPPEVPAMPKPAVSGFAPVNGIRMYFATYGAGPPILLIHGGLASADVWANQVLPLAAAGHEVIVADSRGHGRSTRGAMPIGYDLMASDYVALLDYLKLDRVTLVGWSDGGIIGLDIAMSHPERLTGLFAQGANATVDGIADNLDPDDGLDPFLRWLRRQWQAMFAVPDAPGSLAADVKRMWATEPNWTADQLRSVTVPTEIVAGELDTAITRQHTDYLAATIPGARLVILPGAGHVAMVDDPQTYTRAILTFVDGK